MLSSQRQIVTILFFKKSPNSFVESNIYANKSSVILDWILRIGIDLENFSVREVARETSISLGLVHKIFENLVYHGFLCTAGQHTSKVFFVKKPMKLLQSWLEHYSIIKKCRMTPYRTGLKNKEEACAVLNSSNLNQKVVLALHSAAEALNLKNTNLKTLELYVMDAYSKLRLEKELLLEPQEKGYDVLLIEPYYKAILNKCLTQNYQIAACPVLLTFLDLYHFPLRGLEQAEFIQHRAPELKNINKKT